MGGGHESSQGRSLKSSSATSSQSATSQPQSTEPTPMCYCGRRAKKLTSRTIKNPQRDFYTCDLSQDDFGKCTYFKWVDEWVAEYVAARDEMWKAHVNAELGAIRVEVKMMKYFVIAILMVVVVVFCGRQMA